MVDNLKALHTDIINAGESDNLSVGDSGELDRMYLTIDSAIQSIEKIVQATDVAEIADQVEKFMDK